MSAVIGGCDENDHFSSDGHNARSEVWQKENGPPEEGESEGHEFLAEVLSAALKSAPVPNASASNKLKYVTARGPFPVKNVVYLNLWLANQSRTPSPATRTRTSSRLPAQQAP